jgi:hypothetical protein
LLEERRLCGGDVKRWMIPAALGLAAAGGIVTPGTAQATSSAWHVPFAGYARTGALR